jgi:transmembrane sensor
MNTSHPAAPDVRRLREAGEWIQRLNESTDPTLAEDWMKWCQADPENLPAFESIQSVWDGFSIERTLPAVQSLPAARASRVRIALTAAAAFLIVAGAATWFSLHYSAEQVFDTAVSEQRVETLSDGSRLDLAPDSRVGVRFTEGLREVRLDRGEAFFTVAHNSARPFIVHVNGLTVTAVGTAFDVRAGPSSTVVTVSEGRVSVGPANAPATTVLADVGQRVTFSGPARRLSVAAVDPRMAESWRDGTLQYVGEPLEEVVNDVNRYSRRKIVVAPALLQSRFTGTVSTADVGDWLAALQQIFPVDVVDQGSKGILIQSRDTHATQR